MKHLFLIFLLLNVVFAFAQDDERTPEGYRIIRIDKEQTKTYQDSIAEQRKPSVNFRLSWGLMLSVGYRSFFGNDDFRFYGTVGKSDHSVTIFQGAALQFGAAAWFPLNQYNYALRAGLLFESSYLSCTDDLFINDPESSRNWHRERGRIQQWRVVLPLVAAIKSRTSSFMFELGMQISIPIKDEYEPVSLINDDLRASIDLMDRGLRASVDVAMLLGAHVFLNQYVALDLLWEIQVKKVYDDGFFVGVSDLIAGGLKLGVVFTPF